MEEETTVPRTHNTVMTIVFQVYCRKGICVSASR